MGMYSDLKSSLKADRGFWAACLSVAHLWDTMTAGYSASEQGLFAQDLLLSLFAHHKPTLLK